MNARRSTFHLTPRGEFVRDLVALAIIALVMVASTLAGLALFALFLAAFS